MNDMLCEYQLEFFLVRSVSSALMMHMRSGQSMYYESFSMKRMRRGFSLSSCFGCAGVYSIEGRGGA